MEMMNLREIMVVNEILNSDAVKTLYDIKLELALSGICTLMEELAYKHNLDVVSLWERGTEVTKAFHADFD